MFMGMNFYKASFSGLHAQHEKLSDLYQQYEEFFWRYEPTFLWPNFSSHTQQVVRSLKWFVAEILDKPPLHITEQKNRRKKFPFFGYNYYA